MVGENQSNLTLFLLIMANLIPLVNRFFANKEASNNAKKVIAGTANESSVKGVDQKANVVIARIARIEKQLGIPEPLPDESALYVPIIKEEK
jgi:hypothetical protein